MDPEAIKRPHVAYTLSPDDIEVTADGLIKVNRPKVADSLKKMIQVAKMREALENAPWIPCPMARRSSRLPYYSLEKELPCREFLRFADRVKPANDRCDFRGFVIR